MKIIVCGAGQVGTQIARHLSREQNDVTVIDTDPDMVAAATEALDVEGVVGSAAHPTVLDHAHAADAKMIIAATHLDEVNIVTCQIAHSVFSIPQKVARLRSNAYRKLLEDGDDRLPVDVLISPEREVAAATLHQLAAPETFDTEDFLGGNLEMVGILLDEDCSVVDTPLRQLTELFPLLRATVAGVRRSGTLFVPDSEDPLFPGDEIYVFCHVDHRSRTLEIFGKPSRKTERVIIIGGGNVGLSVARSLEESPERIRAKIIELDRSVAELAADALDRTVVLHGDGLKLEMLEEANIEYAGAVVAVTEDDKTNLLTAVRAKSLGCPLAISLVNDPGLASLRIPLGVDKIVNPRAVTVSSILRHIRHGKVFSVYSIGDAEAEVIEVEVRADSPLEGKAVRNIGLPKGSRIVGIDKAGDVTCPSGDTLVRKGDRIVIFSLYRAIKEIDELI
ncbi:MAG: Trk system potassium transporter TrkA [Paracoccaceae bacterium]|nr:Trk system potassium transporter TrkA [Paracoccaceae bacterium]MDE2914957.1 Trk system potassium transporter TrkA [Paracoccaceae bacterium]